MSQIEHKKHCKGPVTMYSLHIHCGRFVQRFQSKKSPKTDRKYVVTDFERL